MRRSRCSANGIAASRRAATPFFGEIDDGAPAGADLTIAAGDRLATCKARYREFIDHIVTGDRATALIVPGSFEEYTYGLPENRHPSDHCPVSVRFAL